MHRYKLSGLIACLLAVTACKTVHRKARASEVESLSYDEKSTNVFLGIFDSSPNLQPLKGVVSDYERLPANFSDQRIGFVPHKGLNDPYEKVKSQSAAYAQLVGEKGTLIWFFSGHGDRGGNLLIDGQFRNFRDIAQAMLDARNQQPFKRLVIILDSCYSGDIITTTFQDGAAQFPVAGSPSASVPPSNTISVNDLLQILHADSPNATAIHPSPAPSHVVTYADLSAILNEVSSKGIKDQQRQLPYKSESNVLATMARVAASADVNLRLPEEKPNTITIDVLLALLHSTEVGGEVNNSSRQVTPGTRLADELIIFTASQPWETASDGSIHERPGGRFTTALIDNLKSQRRDISISEFMQSTIARVDELNSLNPLGAQQTPKWLAVPEEIKGQKFFTQGNK